MWPKIELALCNFEISNANSYPGNGKHLFISLLDQFSNDIKVNFPILSFSFWTGTISQMVIKWVKARLCPSTHKSCNDNHWNTKWNSRVNSMIHLICCVAICDLQAISMHQSQRKYAQVFSPLQNGEKNHDRNFWNLVQI